MFSDVRQRTQPILEYVHTLENLVRTYRNQRRLFRAGSFLLGVATGVLAAGAVLHFAK